MKDTGKGNVTWWEGKDVAMKTLVMEEVHDVVKSGSKVEGGGDDVVSVGFKGI